MVNTKKILFILFCTIVFGTVSAQDTVSKKNTEKTGGYSLTYQGEVAAAFGLGINDINSALIETVHGVRINPYLFSGLGIGLNYLDGIGLLTPIFNIKGYYPATRKVDFYLSLDLGTTIGIADWGGETDYYTSIGPGINFGGRKGSPRGDFSIRLQHLGTESNTFLFRVGISF